MKFVTGTPARVAGAMLMLGCVLLYEPGATSVIARLWLPLAMGAASALILQNLAGPLLAGVMLAGIHTNLAGDWVAGIAYPGIVALCLVGVILIGTKRFQARIRDTHEARWRERRDRADEDEV